MKTHNKITLGLISLSILTATAFVATTAGSLAWYAYSRSVTVSYTGTSVAKSVLLNVGIVDDENWITDSQLREYDLERKEFDGHSIVFTHSSNGLDSRAIKAYLLKSGRASNMLFPLTTKNRSLDSQDALTLYKSPEFGDTAINTPARDSDYVQIPFAFRIDTKDDEEIVNTNVWLTDAAVQAEGEHINEAVRVFFEEQTINTEDPDVDFDAQRRLFMKPADATRTANYTKVGGLLDLDGDGTYDYDKLYYNEYYYGEHTGVVHNSDGAYGDIPGHLTDYDNVNGVEDETPSTFYAMHHLDAHVIDNLNEIEPLQAHYQTLGTIKPNINGSGNFYEGDHAEGENGYAICSTQSAGGVGYSTISIFIEGWDHVVVDKAAGYSFNLGLKFEVNRL